MCAQVLEDGRQTDSQGRVVSFKNTLLICTSNVGSSVIAKGGSQLGFALPEAQWGVRALRLHAQPRHGGAQGEAPCRGGHYLVSADINCTW